MVVFGLFSYLPIWKISIFDCVFGMEVFPIKKQDKIDTMGLSKDVNAYWVGRLTADQGMGMIGESKERGII